VLLIWLAGSSSAPAQLDWQGDWPDGGSVVAPSHLLAQNVTPAMNDAGRRIRLFPRSSVLPQSSSFLSENGQDRIIVWDSGVNIIIDNVAGFDTVDISTDRLVIWTAADQASNTQGESQQVGDAPLEFYLEGNIIFRQRDQVIYAERMYYNVKEQYGVILDGELLTPIPGYQGLVRLKAEVLRQVNPTRI